MSRVERTVLIEALSALKEKQKLVSSKKLDRLTRSLELYVMKLYRDVTRIKVDKAKDEEMMV